MLSFKPMHKDSVAYRGVTSFISIILIITLVFSPVASYAQSVNLFNLPLPGAMVTPTPAFVPVLLKGMTIHPEDPLKLDFIIDSGNTGFNADQVKVESEKLVKYFLASMTVPKDDLWVNLSPYEKERIIPEGLGRTELGRDLLAQDYILKQLTASLMYPEDKTGSEFWKRIYKLAEEKFGTTDIPVDTFNKVWILPESATVFEHDKSVFVVEGKLKVMLEEDFLAMKKEGEGIRNSQPTKDEGRGTKDETSELSARVLREIIIPEIEKEVNFGKNFAPLRQIYHSLILAKWYKQTIKESLLSKVYVDQNKVAGVSLEDDNIKNEIYERYMQAYKKGVYNYIKEDYDRLSQQMIPRKYFSGGIIDQGVELTQSFNARRVEAGFVGPKFKLALSVQPEVDGGDNAMVSREEARRRIEEKLDPKYHHLIKASDDLLKFLNDSEHFQREVLPKIKMFVTDVGGTLKDGDPDHLSQAVAALGRLLKTGMPVRIVSMGGLSSIEKDIIKEVFKTVAGELRKNVEVFWGGGIIKTQFDAQGNAADVTKDMSAEYREKYFISAKDYDVIEQEFKQLGIAEPIYKNDAEGVGTAQFGIGKFESGQERDAFREKLLQSLPDSIKEKVDILDDGDGVNFIALVIRRKGVGKASAFDDLLKKYHQDEITYIGDQNDKGGPDEGVTKLGVVSVALDPDQTKAHKSAIRFKGFTGVPAAVQWMEVLTENVLKRREGAISDKHAMVSIPEVLSTVGNVLGDSTVKIYLRSSSGGDQRMEIDRATGLRFDRSANQFVVKDEEGKVYSLGIYGEKVSPGTMIASSVVFKTYIFPGHPFRGQNTESIRFPSEDNPSSLVYTRVTPYDSSLDDIYEYTLDLGGAEPALSISFSYNHASDYGNFKPVEVPGGNRFVGQEAVDRFLKEIRHSFGDDNAMVSDTSRSVENAWVQAESIREIRDEQGRLLVKEGGPVSNLSPELWKLVRTDTFKRWFGDWENDPEGASKIVDENGEPLVVRHASPSKFTVFKQDKVLAYDHRLHGGKPRLQSSHGSGMSFGVKQNVIDTFSDGKETYVYEVFLNVRNPRIIDSKNFREDPKWGALRTEFLKLRDEFMDASESRKTVIEQRLEEINRILREAADQETQEALKAGHDGTMDSPEYRDINGKRVPRPSTRTYNILVYEPESGGIKSIENAGTFDANDPDIFEGKIGIIDRQVNRVIPEDIEIHRSRVVNSKINLGGQFIVMDPKDVDVEVSVEQKMVDRDLVNDSIGDRPVDAGRTVREVVEQSSAGDDILLAFNSIVGNFYAANSMVLQNGELIRKPDGVLGVGQKEYAPLSGTFWLLPLDKGADDIVPIEIVEGEATEAIPYANGVFGPVLIKDGKSNLDNINFGQFPEVGGSDLGFDRSKRQAMSAMGYTADGKLFRATLFGDPNDLSKSNEGNEPNIEEFVDYLLQSGVKNAVLMGTVADVKTYVAGAEQPYSQAIERRGKVEKKMFQSEGLDADDIFRKLEKNGFMEMSPLDSTVGVLTDYVGNIEPKLEGVFGQNAEKVLKVLKSSRESFLGAIFPQGRPNATHIVVHKRSDSLLDSENNTMVSFADPGSTVITENIKPGVRVSMWYLEPKKYQSFLVVDESLEGVFSIDRGTNTVYDENGRKITFAQQRSSVSTVEDLLKKFADENPGKEIVGITGNENVFYNKPVISVQADQQGRYRAYQARNGTIKEGRDYPMYVVYSDRTARVEEHVRFEMEEKGEYARVLINGEPVQDGDIRWATIVQLILNENGFTAPNKSNHFAELYDDPKHLFVMPSIKIEGYMSDGVFFMADQILSDPERINRYFQDPSKPQDFYLSYTITDEKGRPQKKWLKPEQLAPLLQGAGYREEDYSFKKDAQGKDMVAIRLKENGYPFHLIAETKDHQLVEIATRGPNNGYGKFGATIREVAEWLRSQGFVRAGVIDQGKTVRLTVGEETYVPQTLDERAASIIVYARPKSADVEDDAMVSRSERHVRIVGGMEARQTISDGKIRRMPELWPSLGDGGAAMTRRKMLGLTFQGIAAALTLSAGACVKTDKERSPKDYSREEVYALLDELVGYDPSWVERQPAFQTLMRTGPEQALFMMDYANDPNNNTDARKWAILLTGSVGDYNDVIYFLIDVAKSGSWAWWHEWEAWNAIWDLFDRQPDPMFLAVSQLLPDPDPDVREVAVQVIWGYLDEPQYVHNYEPYVLLLVNVMLNDPERMVRREAAYFLSRLQDPITVPGFTQALFDEFSYVRQIAAEVLGEIGDVRAVPALGIALSDPQQRDPLAGIRVICAESLGAIGDRSALPALEYALINDPDPDVRQAAQDAINRINNQDDDAMVAKDGSSEDDQVARRLKTLDSRVSDIEIKRLLGRAKLVDSRSAVNQLRDLVLDHDNISRIKPGERWSIFQQAMDALTIAGSLGSAKAALAVEEIFQKEKDWLVHELMGMLETMVENGSGEAARVILDILRKESEDTLLYALDLGTVEALELATVKYDSSKAREALEYIARESNKQWRERVAAQKILKKLEPGREDFDDAMVAGSSSQDAPGGIDMNTIDVNRQGEGVKIEFDPAAVDPLLKMNINGFTPVIINVTPIQSILPLLGLDPKAKEEEFEISRKI